MSLIEVGHASWERHDADRVAWALLEHAACISVRLVPPEDPLGGWSVAATYFDEPAPRLFQRPRGARGGR
jgi:hypothetical protein